MDSNQYEAGSGRVLSHFASLMTPDTSKKSDWKRQSLHSSDSASSSSIRQSKQVKKVFDDYVLDNRTESSDMSSDMSAGTVKSYPLSFSPPYHSLKKPNAVVADRSTLRSSLGTSYRTEDSIEAMEEETYSPVTSSVKFLMSRDPDEEERVLYSKSDRDKVYLYKKRYTDTYEHAVALLKHAASLERERADKQSDLEYLRLTVQTQTQIINTLSENQQLSEPTDHQQEKQIQALCREVTGLVMQLSQRDSLINSLQNERDKSAEVIKELNMSQSLGSTSGSETVQSTDVFRDKLEAALRDKQEALERESRLTVQLKDLQQLYDKCEAARSALSDGLDRAEKQTTALHAQWTQEKKEMLASVQEDDQKSAKLVAECERLRKDNKTVKASLFQLSENEKKHQLMMKAQKQVVDNSLVHIAQLQSELNELRPQQRELSERETRINALEKDLSGSREKLRRCLMRVKELEERLEQREKEVQATKYLMLKQLDEASIIRYITHNLQGKRLASLSLTIVATQVMELKGNIRVFCRVRPVLRHELADSRNEEIFAFPDYRTERRQIELSANPKSHVGYGQSGSRSIVKKYNFDFDFVFDSKCSQEDVFLEVSALIQSALDGYNVCVFAYGQTGYVEIALEFLADHKAGSCRSGKTYTMQGKEKDYNSKLMESSPDMGIVGRAILHIFAGIDDLRSSGWSFVTSLELVEIYNETLRDLLAPAEVSGYMRAKYVYGLLTRQFTFCTLQSTDKIDLRLDSEGKIAVVNSCIRKVQSSQEAWSLLQGAMSKRLTKSTKLNDRSSRSHCVITFRLSGKNSLTGDQRTGVINLVDLAHVPCLPHDKLQGSERLSKSGSDSNKELLKEATSINKSLSALGNVICALAKKSTHVPFRDSKLTYFLSSSLGGDSKTLMICNLSPLGNHRDETLNSLRFAKMVNSCEIAYPSTVYPVDRRHQRE
ncbi:hypothetical protein DD238_001524 [Peronospora effusa]|uniref:Kinesin motor domain-containing protein n=1 Tax=Peronospora effusa TaxID=542832 RepID=A0A3M6VUN7_9STRA|nr:hypothetical protein DD238_001524 [Peronospora effusa]